VKLAVHQPGRSATVIDEDETVSGEEGHTDGSPPPSRAVRLVMGLAMMVVGALLAGVSSWALMGTDEAPPPLLEASDPSGAGSGATPKPSAAPSR
jgi:hypothetical protein